MIKIYREILQGSPEWFAIRKQYPLTASKAEKIASYDDPKSKGKGLNTLIITALSQKYSSGEPPEDFCSDDMETGIELEPIARELYELETGSKVVEVGFITDDEISKVGGVSPDGLVNEYGLCEIKCLKDKNYFEALVEFKKTGKWKIPTKHAHQMQMQMLFAHRSFNDYVLYNPNYAPSLLIQRVLPDPAMQAKIREGLKIGEKLIEEIEASLK